LRATRDPRDPCDPGEVENMLKAAEVERRGPVGWVVIKNVQDLMEQGWSADEFVEIHTAISLGLEELRFDRSIRVVGITGQKDGEFYRFPRRKRFDEEQRHRDRHNRLKARTDSRLHGKGPGRGVPSAIETLALMDKPVIARVNGDAIGYGQSLLWACDLIVAMQNAVVSDSHMAQGEVTDSNGEKRGFPTAVTPGDGAMAFMPMFMPPTKLKEYQFFSRAWTGKQLAEMNVVNYALATHEELDAKVDELIGELLARPQHALARTKKLTNKALINMWNLNQDLSSAYESLDFWEHTADGHMEPGWAYQPVVRPAGGWCPTGSVKP
jgi:enoyl-CoA hydratase/carnithine racemase